MQNNKAKLKIKQIKAKIILDSRKKPTIEVKISTNIGFFKASVPSGTSTGKYEAKIVEPEKAIENINRVIFPALQKAEFDNLEKIDGIMTGLDGTREKSNLGANAILAVSIACTRALAKANGLTLYKYISLISGSRPAMPQPCFLLYEAGIHGKGTKIQEFMVVPGKNSFSENLKTGKKIYEEFEKILKREKNKRGLGYEKGLEGGYTGIFGFSGEILRSIAELKKIGKAEIYIDCAASGFFRDGFYEIDRKKMSGEELADYYRELTIAYPVFMIEDPFIEEDWSFWQDFMASEKRLLIIGDDLTVSNPEKIKEAQQKKACNGLILKPNQIGSVSETIEASRLAKEFGWKIIVSHRSGETKDDFIADLAVGISADFIKSGAPGPSERMVKYNRLLKIEKSISDIRCSTF